MKKNKLLKFLSLILTIVILINSYSIALLSLFRFKSEKNNKKNDLISSFMIKDSKNKKNYKRKKIADLNNDFEYSFKKIFNKDYLNCGFINNETQLFELNSSHSNTICNLNINDNIIKVMDYSNGWDLVKTGDVIGFIEENNITYSNKIDNKSPDIIPYKDIVICSSDLNFRKESNTTSEILTTFKKGQELEVLGKLNKEWLLCKYNGQLGFINSNYTISLLNKINNEYPKLNLENLEIKKIIYTTSNVNLQKDISTNSKIINVFDRLESVRVIEEYDEYYLVLTNDYELGYIDKSLTKELNDFYIIIDLSDQKMKLYKDNILYFTTPVTTGKDSTPSDKGLFRIYYKHTDCYITETAFVHFWMAYNGGEGIHDASWRNVYGTDDYRFNGSHGCINTPYDMAKAFYEKSDINTRVLVQK